MKPLLDAAITFRDPEILAAITLADQTRVLAALGWHYWANIELDCETWVKWVKGDVEPKVLIAVNDRPADRVNRIAELVHSLAALENIPVLLLILMFLPEIPIGIVAVD